MFIEHHTRPKTASELKSVIDSITVEMIKLNEKFRHAK